MDRITSVVDAYKKTGITPCRGFGLISRNTGCALVASAMAKSGLPREDIPHIFESLGKLIGIDASRDYLLSFSWGFDSGEGNSLEDYKSYEIFDLQGFLDGQACRKEL